MSRHTSKSVRIVRAIQPVVRQVGTFSAVTTSSAALVVPLAAHPVNGLLQVAIYKTGLFSIGLAVGDKVGEAIDKKFDEVVEVMENIDRISEEKRTR